MSYILQFIEILLNIYLEKNLLCTVDKKHLEKSYL